MTEKRYIDDPVEQKRRAALLKTVAETKGPDGIVDELEEWCENARRFCNVLHDRARDPDVETDDAFYLIDDLRSNVDELAESLLSYARLIESFAKDAKAAGKEIPR